MRTVLSRTLFALLAALVLLSLPSCKTEDSPSRPAPEGYYTAVHTPLSGGDAVSCAARWQDRWYWVSRPEAEAATMLSQEELIEHSAAQSDALWLLDGGEPRLSAPFFGFQKACCAENLQSHSVLQMTGGPEGLWLLTRRFDNTPGSAGPTLHLLLLDQTGAVTRTVPLSLLYDEGWLSPQMVCDREGYLYLLGSEGKTVVLDPQGTLLGQLTFSAPQSAGLILLADGRAAVCGINTGLDSRSWQVQAIDPKTPAFSAGASLPRFSDYDINCRFFSGWAGYDFLCDTGLSLYGCRLESGEAEQVLCWLNCGIEGAAVLALAPEGDGLTCLSWSDLFGGETASLTLQPAASGPERTLSLACRKLPQAVAQAVLRFNRQDSGLRVEIRDYGDNAGGTSGLDRLSADLAAGRTPDLLCTQGMNVQNLIDRGLLEDLWPYIDGDETLGGREGLVQPVFNAFSQNGKLYQVAGGFQLDTAVGLTRLVGEDSHWTVEDFLALYQSGDYTAFTAHGRERLQALAWVEWGCSEDFIDREAGVARFDSPEFVAILECLAALPDREQNDSYQETRSWFADGRLLVDITTVTEPLDLAYRQIDAAGQPVTYVGFPWVKGNGGLFSLEEPMAMSAACPDKEAAWAFLRTVLLPENQRFPQLWWNVGSQGVYSMPTNKAVFDLMMEQAMHKPANFTAYMIGPYGQRTEVLPLTREQAGAFWQLIEGTTAAFYCDPSVTAIISDEAERFFAGDQTAQAAAKAIQSRVNLYLGERK